MKRWIPAYAGMNGVRGIRTANKKRPGISPAVSRLRSRSPRRKSVPRRSDKVEAIGVHHLGPRRHEVFHKLLLRVRARIDFRKRPQLRVRTEDQVDTRD